MRPTRGLSEGGGAAIFANCRGPWDSHPPPPTPLFGSLRRGPVDSGAQHGNAAARGHIPPMALPNYFPVNKNGLGGDPIFAKPRFS